MAPRIVEALGQGDAIVPIAEAIETVWKWDWACPGCRARVRIHRQRKPSGPAPHFEHRRKNPECPLMKR